MFEYKFIDLFDVEANVKQRKILDKFKENIDYSEETFYADCANFKMRVYTLISKFREALIEGNLHGKVPNYLIWYKDSYLFYVNTKTMELERVFELSSCFKITLDRAVSDLDTDCLFYDIKYGVRHFNGKIQITNLKNNLFFILGRIEAVAVSKSKRPIYPVLIYADSIRKEVCTIFDEYNGSSCFEFVPVFGK